MADVTEHQGTLDGEPVFWLQADVGGAVPVLYVHGVPTSADDWPVFLERSGGLAPDLPGFGRSGKRGDGDYTMHRYGPWLERFLEDRGVDRFSLVVHDWGAVGLLLAQASPERVHRLVVIDAVPLLPDYRWHRVARIWRTRGLGELFMGSVNRFSIKQVTRESNATKGPMPDAWLDSVAAHLDLGTQRAILRLYRHADPDVLAAAGERLGQLTCPTLVVWGDEDPYIPASFADGYGARIPGAQVQHVAGAGHWPWLDRPEIVETITAFLAG
jgi:pimeloyl-ACP methyl ester carboxylesterase